MKDQAKHDEQLLIDDLRGRLDDEESEILRKRLDEQPELRKRREDIKNTFKALDLYPEPQAPDSLLEDTMARIASVRKTNALLNIQQMRSPLPFRSTFSLRELGAIAAILIMAAGVLIPSLRMAHQRSQQSLCAAQMGQLGSAMQTYAINSEGKLPKPNHAGGHRWLRNSEPPVSNSAGLFKLIRGRYLSSPVVFQCPAVGGNSFVVRDEMHDFPHESHISYSYNYSLGSHDLSINDKSLQQVAASLAILGDQTPLFKNGRFQSHRLESMNSDNHSRRGQNVLYLDGHVIWAASPHAGVEKDNIYLADNLRDYKGTEKPISKTDTFLLPAFVGR